jgi:hypothetical protein
MKNIISKVINYIEKDYYNKSNFYIFSVLFISLSFIFHIVLEFLKSQPYPLIVYVLFLVLYILFMVWFAKFYYFVVSIKEKKYMNHFDLFFIKLYTNYKWILIADYFLFLRWLFFSRYLIYNLKSKVKSDSSFQNSDKKDKFVRFLEYKILFYEKWVLKNFVGKWSIVIYFLIKLNIILILWIIIYIIWYLYQSGLLQIIIDIYNWIGVVENMWDGNNFKNFMINRLGNFKDIELLKSILEINFIQNKDLIYKILPYFSLIFLPLFILYFIFILVIICLPYYLFIGILNISILKLKFFIETTDFEKEIFNSD